MLMSFNKLAFAVICNKDTNRFWRPATGDIDFATPTKDDVPVDDETYEVMERTGDCITGCQTLLVFSLSQIRKVFWSQIAVMIMIPTTFWIFSVVQLWNAMLMYLSGGDSWDIFAFPAFFMMLALLFTPQAINPTVRDLDDHWINLRTGVSNLNGHSCLLRKV